MNIIDIYNKLKQSYKDYISSFVSIKDERVLNKKSVKLFKMKNCGQRH